MNNRRFSGRLLTALLTVCLLATAFAGCAGAAAYADVTAPYVEGGMELTLLYSDNPSFPFKKDWIVLTEVKKRTNVDLLCQVVPSTDAATKLKLLLNSGDAPDLFSNGEKLSQFALGGVMLPISDYMDKMPALTSRIEAVGAQSDMENMTESDGKLYLLPHIYEIGAYTSGTAIRVDLLEKYGLSMPESYEDLYEFLKVVKQNDPQSAGTSMFWGLNQVLSFMDPTWNFSHHIENRNVYYDYDEGVYKASATSPIYKDMLTYLRKLYAEGLIDPEIFTSDVDQWTQKMVSGKAAVTWCWGDQIDGVNAAGRENFPDFTLKNIYPLKINNDSPDYTLPVVKANAYWGMSSALAKRADIDTIISFVDWFLYSEEAAILTNWGVEGETFNVVDGKRIFVDSLLSAANGPSKQAQIDYGLFNNTLTATWMEDRYYLYMGPEAEEISRTMNEKGQFLPSQPQPKLSIDDIETLNLLAAPIKDYVDRSSEAFITGTMDLDADWDAYVGEIEAKGIQEMVDMYNAGIK